MGDAVFGLVVGEAFVLELVDETIVGEGHVFEVGGGAFGGLFVPVGATVVGGVDSVGVGVFFVFELFDETAIREGHVFEVGLGATESVALARGHRGRGIRRFRLGFVEDFVHSLVDEVFDGLVEGGTGWAGKVKGDCVNREDAEDDGEPEPPLFVERFFR